jgi:hypothetical protein
VSRITIRTIREYLREKFVFSPQWQRERERESRNDKDLRFCWIGTDVTKIYPTNSVVVVSAVRDVARGGCGTR